MHRFLGVAGVMVAFVTLYDAVQTIVKTTGCTGSSLGHTPEAHAERRKRLAALVWMDGWTRHDVEES